MLVSVIIATYNFGHYIEEAVDSVLAQGVDDIEVIVVDDGSTDDTCVRITNLGDPRVRLVQLEKVGVGAARNEGLRLARGKYLAFLDADDRWRTGKLARQLAVLESEPTVSMVFTNFTRFDEVGTFPETQFDFVPELASLSVRPSRAGQASVLQVDTVVGLAATNQFPAWIQTVLLRAETVRGIEFPPDMRLSQDYCYMLRVYSVTVAAFIADPLVEVRRHRRNSYTRADEKLEPDIVALTRVSRELLREPHRRALRQRLGRAYLALGHHHFWHGHVVAAAAAYTAALFLPRSRMNALKHLIMLPVAPVLCRMQSRPAAPAATANRLTSRHRADDGAAVGPRR